MTMISFRSVSAALLKAFPQFVKIGRLFAAAAKGDVVRGLPLEQIRQLRRFVSVVEQLIEWNFESSRQLLECFNRRNGVAVLHPRNVAPQQSRSLLNVALRELLALAQFPQTIADYHDGLFLGLRNNGDDETEYSSIAQFYKQDSIRFL